MLDKINVYFLLEKRYLRAGNFEAYTYKKSKTR